MPLLRFRTKKEPMPDDSIVRTQTYEIEDMLGCGAAASPLCLGLNWKNALVFASSATMRGDTLGFKWPDPTHPHLGEQSQGGLVTFRGRHSCERRLVCRRVGTQSDGLHLLQQRHCLDPDEWRDGKGPKGREHLNEPRVLSTAAPSVQCALTVPSNGRGLSRLYVCVRRPVGSDEDGCQRCLAWQDVWAQLAQKKLTEAMFSHGEGARRVKTKGIIRVKLHQLHVKSGCKCYVLNAAVGHPSPNPHVRVALVPFGCYF